MSADLLCRTNCPLVELCNQEIEANSQRVDDLAQQSRTAENLEKIEVEAIQAARSIATQKMVGALLNKFDLMSACDSGPQEKTLLLKRTAVVKCGSEIALKH